MVPWSIADPIGREDPQLHRIIRVEVERNFTRISCKKIDRAGGEDVNPANRPIPVRRIYHVVYNRYPADPRVRRAVEAVSSAEFSVTVLCATGPGERKVEMIGTTLVRRLPLEAVRGSRFRYLYQYTLFFLLAAIELLPRVRRGRYSIIHVHSLPDLLVFAALPARLLGVRIVLDLHESMAHLYLARFHDRPGSVVHRLVQVSTRLACLIASRVVTVNATIQGLLKAEGVPESKLLVVENTPAWRGEDQSGDANHSSRDIVIVGGLNRERDLELLLQAERLLRPHHPPRIRLIGHGTREYIAALETTRSSLGLDDCVSIEPEISPSTVRTVLSTTLFGVVTYERNPLTEIATPNKAYEYASLGKAIVIADLPAIRQLFGAAVLYYSPGDAISLAAAMRTLMEDASLRDKLGQRAAAVHASHSWELMVRRLRGLYEELAPVQTEWELPG